MFVRKPTETCQTHFVSKYDISKLLEWRSKLAQAKICLLSWKGVRLPFLRAWSLVCTSTGWTAAGRFFAAWAADGRFFGPFEVTRYFVTRPFLVAPATEIRSFKVSLSTERGISPRPLSSAHHESHASCENLSAFTASAKNLIVANLAECWAVQGGIVGQELAKVSDLQVNLQRGGKLFRRVPPPTVDLGMQRFVRPCARG